MLEIRNLHADFEDTSIVRGVSLTIRPGEIHAIMGPNGSGKSTLAKVIAGHPAYHVSQGDILLHGKSLLSLPPEERVHAGIFLSFQNPREISGVQYRKFLHTIVQTHILHKAGKTLKEARKERELRKQLSPVFFRKSIEQKMPELHMKKNFLERSVNEGFSGGEKKKSEILQMELLHPQYALLDELDSGLDIDALKIVCERVNILHRKSNMGILLITHYPKILEYITPDKVHLFSEGKIQQTGDISLAHNIEKTGYMSKKT